MKSIYKKILSIGLLSVLFEFVITRSVYAEGGIMGGLITIGSDVITTAAQTILGLTTYLAQKIFMLGGMLIELAMQLNNNILDPSSNIFLFKGWTVFVNVADLALVISLIIIAFATMLNSQTYGMQKALPRLIIIALLVNFSLVIPGVLMDFSGMVTEFFVEQSGLSGNNITSALASAFDVSGFLEVNNAKVGGAQGGVNSSIMSIIISNVFVIIFTLISAVIMLTIAILLFVRYFMLTFLLTLTPIVFVAWIFPGTQKHWHDWWNRFVRWTMFPPVMIFFMWLSLTSLSAFKSAAPMPGGAMYTAQDGLLFNLGSIIQMAMAVMLMIMSLIAANSISISGAKGGKDMIGSMTNWGRTKIDKMGSRARGTAAGGAASVRRESARLGRRGAAGIIRGVGLEKGSLAARKFEGEKGGLLGRAAGMLGRTGERVTENQRAALKKTYEEKFKGMSNDNLALRYSTMSGDEQIFAVQQLAKSGDLGKLNEKQVDNAINNEAAFAKYGGEKAYGSFTKAVGKNKAMVTVAANKPTAGFKDGKAESTEAKKWQEEWDKATEELYKNFSSATDYASLPPKLVMDNSDFGKEARKRIVAEFPGAIARIASKVKKADAREFNRVLMESLTETQAEAMKLLDDVAEEVGAPEGEQLAGMDMKEKYEHVKKHGKPEHMERLKGNDYRKMIRVNESFEKSMFSRLRDTGEEKK